MISLSSQNVQAPYFADLGGVIFLVVELFYNAIVSRGYLPAV
jgi:hypothetical protein